MKTDVDGCSTTKAGQEQFEEFETHGKKFVQYDYRNRYGELFTCIAPSLEEARKRRNHWMGEDY